MIVKSIDAPGRAHPSTRTGGRHFDRHILPYLMLIPALLILLAVIVGPSIYAIVISFKSWDLTNPLAVQPFVGLQNYRTLLSVQYFSSALQSSLLFAVLPPTIEL